MMRFSRSRARLGRSSAILAAAVGASLYSGVAWGQASGTWSNLAGGNWNLLETGNWVGGIVADGADQTADFSTINITGDRTITLTEARTIGNLLFNDITTASHTYTLAGSPLTLAVTSGSPTITVGNMGANKAVTISANVLGSNGLTKAGTGQLTLSGTNTYTGGTTINAGTLLATQTAALSGYNAPGQVVVNAGSLALAIGGLGFASADIDSVLANATFNAGSALTLQAASGFTYAGNITQPASVNKTGTGTLSLTGTSNLTGSFNVTTGIVSIDAGSLTAAGTSQVNTGQSLIVNGGSATFTGTLRTENNPNAVIRVNSGNLTANNLQVQRNSNANTPVYTSGFIVAGGTANVTNAIIGSANSTGAMSVEGGTFTGGTVTIGNQQTSGRGGGLQVINTGTVFNATELVLSKANGTNGNNLASATFAGGISTIDTLTMGFNDTLTAGNANVIINGGTVYIGSGGIVKGAQASTATTINLTNGTLGAKANWSSDRNMSLNGAGFTIKAADAAEAGFNISLSGILSGAGALTKTGTGSLTLTGPNTYTGNVDVAAGSLIGTAESLRNTITNSGAITFDQATNATFAGSIIGAGTVRKTGAGTLALNPQTYTGATSVGGGTLRLAGSHATSGVTIENGSTLAIASGGATVNALTLGAAGGAAMTLAVNSGTGLNTLNVTSTNGLSTAGTTTIDIGLAGITTGTHTLVDYAGTIGGSGFGGFSLGSLPSRVNASLVHNVGNTSVDLNVTLVDFPRWEGTAGDDWDINNTVNWKEATSGNATTYLQNSVPGDQVLFTDAATGTTTVELVTTVQPTFVTVNNGTKNYTFTGSGKISGVAGMTKQGTGSLTISNTGGNDYSGTTTLSAGSIILGADNVLSDNSPIDVAGGTLDVNTRTDSVGPVTLTSGSIAGTSGALIAPSYDLHSGTVGIMLAGTGGVNKTTAGTVNLNVAASYTGNTNVQNGTLALGVANTLPLTTQVVIGNGTTSGTLELNGNSQIVDSISTSGTGTANAISNSSGTQTILTVGNTAARTFNGAINGNVALVHGGTAELRLGGVSNFTGGTTVNFGGILTIDSDAALGAIPGSPTTNLTFTDAGPARLRAGAAAITLDANRTIDINGITLDLESAGGGSTMTINGTIQGGGFLNKAGNGTVVLNGTNTYASTTISAGELRAGNANALGSGTVTINAGNGQLQLANGITFTNAVVSANTSSNNMINVPEDGATATYAGTFTAGAGFQYRPGASGAGATLVLTGAATLSNTLVVAQGNVVVANNGSITANQGLLGRATTANMSFTMKDNAQVSFGTNVSLGIDNNVPDLDLTVQDNASLSVGTTFDLIAVNATPETAHSDVNLNGGTLTVGSFLKGAAAATRTSTLHFNGGTLRANASTAAFLPAFAGVNGSVENGGAIIDTNGFDIAIGAPLQAGGTGGLTKNGAGVLTLNGANSYTGATNVNSGTLALGNSLTTSSSFNVNGTSVARIDPAGNRVLKTPDLNLAASAKLDLGDNKLVVSEPLGTWTGSGYAANTVSGLVDVGRGNASNAQWDGNGIVTSDTRAVNNNDLVSIGTAKVGAIKGIADGATTTFAGQTVLGSDSIAMVTWGGDANLDGKINIDDYGQIDFNVSSSGSVFGWYNGDFNYDGKINIDDYGIIDFNVSAQNSIFPTTGGVTAGLDGVAAVPEPAGLSLIVLGAALARRRRRPL